jgi:hypothetical protein
VEEGGGVCASCMARARTISRDIEPPGSPN